jgi:cytochrome c553
MTGANSRRFVQNYGFFVHLGSYRSSSVVVCTTCHDPHSMRAVNITGKSNSGLPRGTYVTAFFLRAPYNPNNTNPRSNTAAQFCRQCHADKSNEMNGSTAGTVL